MDWEVGEETQGCLLGSWLSDMDRWRSYFLRKETPNQLRGRS
jgi:hypothetical protein